METNSEATSQTTYQTIQLQKSDSGVWTLTVNRPEALNALNELVLTEMEQATQQIAKMDFSEAKALIITGRGEKAFVAGADIKQMKGMTVDQALHTVRPPNRKVPDSVAEIYLMMMNTGSRAYNAALRTLADPDALPAVYFCMAGKDRTGVFSAVLLGLLGVSDQDIVDDYVLTHEVVETIHERGRAERGPTTDEENALWESLPPEIRGAHASTMEGMVAGVPGLFGSWEGYAEYIGVGDDVISVLRRELIEDGS